MRTRAQVQVKFNKKESIYLYQHFDGYNLMSEVCAAIRRGKERWNDSDYLTRIIFSEMIKDDVMGETGYGIGLHQAGDIEYLITVDIKDQTVTETKMRYDGTNKRVLRSFNFNEIPETVNEFIEED